MTDEELFGRKVFFLNPDNNTKREIIPLLLESEYEIYVIDSYKEAFAYLRHNPTAILFINIENQLTQKGWFNFIKSCHADQNTSSVIIGVMSAHLKDDDKKIFVNNGNIKAGVIDTFESNEKIVEKLKEVMDKFNAKGRRQFVRADCKNDKEAKLYWNIGSKMHVLKIQDISSVGLAAVGPASFLKVLQKGSVLRGLSVLLSGKQHSTEATVFVIKPYGTEFCMLVLLFLKSTPPTTKENIRQYISTSLQNAMMDSVVYEQKDVVQYNNLSYWDEAVNGNQSSAESEEENSTEQEQVFSEEETNESEDASEKVSSENTNEN